MKKLLVILVFMPGILSCSKEEKLTVTCQGDCHNYSFKINNETGPVSANITTNYSYDSNGSVSQATASGTYTFENTGNSYQVRQVVNYSTCKYTVTVNNESSCGN
ncbi:MAG: hypothetical protein JW801_18190 [Bacteroidales bacterium]|nr:hypothetical protein [Bacteroidales bacterium]